MPNLNLFTISGLVIVVTYIPMMYCIIQDKKNRERFTFYIFHLTSIFLWGVGSIAIGLASSKDQAATIWKWAYIPVIFIPNFFSAAIFSLNDSKDKLLPFLNVLGIFIVVLTLTGNLLGEPRIVHNNLYYVHGTPLASLHLAIWSSTVLWGYYNLIRFYKRNINAHQNLFLLLVTPIAFVGGSLNFFIFYKDTSPPIGNFLISIYSAAVTYAILRHQFLDIKVVIQKSLVYSVLISIISIGYLITVLISEKFLQNLVGYQSFMISGIFAFGLGLLFIPLKNFIEELVNRYLFKGSPPELSAKIDKYHQEVRQIDKYKTAATMASGLAHEIRNPLTAIQTFCEYLPEKINDKPFLQNFATIVQKESKRINSLVNQLSDHTRPSPLELKKTPIHRFLDETINFLNSRFVSRRITVNKDFNPQDTTLLLIDENQIRQAILNILLNAIDAMPQGGHLTVSTAHSHEDGRGYLEIHIEDTGVGIQPDKLQKIFETFYTEKESGTGLGLSITKEIVEHHRGKITVTSEPGKGSDFAIVLPLTENSPGR